MPKKLMMATIDLLIEVEDDNLDEGRAADLIGETLRPLLREYNELSSDLIDWRYHIDPHTGYCYAENHDGSGFELADDKYLDKQKPQAAVVSIDGQTDGELSASLGEMLDREKLWQHCQKFITDQRIHCGETVYQSDRVIQNGYEFIHEACKIVGFFKDPDDEEDED